MFIIPTAVPERSRNELWCKVNFINQSHQHTGVEEKSKYYYNYNQAKKIFDREEICVKLARARSNKSKIGNTNVVKERHNCVKQAENEQPK